MASKKCSAIQSMGRRPARSGGAGGVPWSRRGQPVGGRSAAVCGRSGAFGRGVGGVAPDSDAAAAEAPALDARRGAGARAPSPARSSKQFAAPPDNRDRLRARLPKGYYSARDGKSFYSIIPGVKYALYCANMIRKKALKPPCQPSRTIRAADEHLCVVGLLVHRVLPWRSTHFASHLAAGASACG